MEKQQQQNGGKWQLPASHKLKQSGMGRVERGRGTRENDEGRCDEGPEETKL